MTARILTWRRLRPWVIEAAWCGAWLGLALALAWVLLSE